MGKLRDLDAFDRGQIVGVRSMGHSNSEIVSQLGISRSTVSKVYQEYMDGRQKTSDRANCKGHLALAVRGSLVHVPTSLNAIRYLELLGDHLHPFMLFCFRHGNGIFQQDNCTSHKSWWATGWLDEHSSDFSVVNWSLRSPVLNPIEHLWDVLGQGVKGHHTAPTNLTEFWTALAILGKSFPGNVSRNLLNLCLICGSRYQGQRRPNSY
ncbi:transposable element Tcb2 transposase [Trichonephila clavipes]|nr:transposable element Tcb2 transposase [Trichonephila clavipes]